MQQAISLRLFCVVLLSLYHVCSVQAASGVPPVQNFPDRRFQCHHRPRCAFEDVYQRAVVLDLNPVGSFKPRFVAQSLDIYNMNFIQIKDNGTTVTGIACGLSPCGFRQQMGAFIVALGLLDVLRATIYKHHPFQHIYIIDEQRKFVSRDLPGLFDNYPESYFLKKEETAYITNKLEKNPGTNGSKSTPE